MNIDEFIKAFTNEKINYTRVGEDYFLVSEDCKELVEKHQPVAAGIFLGKGSRRFSASLPLLDILSQKSDKKIFITAKGEWLFVCGRDIMRSAVDKCNVKNGLVLVQNYRDENLGLGRINKDPLNSPGKEIVVTNILHKGEYLGR